MRLHQLRFALCIALMGFAAGSPQAEPAHLMPRIDPFEKPAPEVKPELPPALENNYAQEEVAQPPELPQLRAILHSQRNTLVNLDGTMVPLGESYAGYRVAAAGARDVVLLAGDKTIVISIGQKDKPDVRLR